MHVGLRCLRLFFAERDLYRRILLADTDPKPKPDSGLVIKENGEGAGLPGLTGPSGYELSWPGMDKAA